MRNTQGHPIISHSGWRARFGTRCGRCPHVWCSLDMRCSVPWPWEAHRDWPVHSHSGWQVRFGTRCVRRPMCGMAWATGHKIASWLLAFSVARYYCKSIVFGPLPAFRTPPPIACCRPLMDSLWATAFWLFGRQTPSAR